MTSQPLTLIEIESMKYRIQGVIEDFKTNYDTIKRSEANTETRLIEELFMALGWDKKDWSKRERTFRGEKRGYSDYEFFINGKRAFVLEAKKLGVELKKEGDMQSISYALSAGFPFAVSTNFECLNIFCVEQYGDITKKKFRAFDSPEQYISRINDLLYLSKRSFEIGTIIKVAESEDRLKERNSMDKSLLDELMKIRRLIANDIDKKYHGEYSGEQKDEIIQRIIDRLIFIRNCEDRNMGVAVSGKSIKLSDITHLTHSEAYRELKMVFKEYNKVYNSGLFEIGKDNDCDTIEIDGDIIKKLIKRLYEPEDESFYYDFDKISADILGQVYEQYLSILLKQEKSGKSKLKDGHAHKKEQGIYYTPTYIVDYIVKNTLGETLKDKKVDATKIKVLDPACGSGSFLIKAFDYLNDTISAEERLHHRLDSQGMHSVKTEIIKNNLYGVDLDIKAVEIAKLSLLLKASEKYRKLPEEIDEHVKHGNSLVDDKALAGLNAFVWNERFNKIMKDGRFDIVMGNPPWGSKIEDGFEGYYKNRYTSTNRELESHLMFMELCVNLTKDEGYIGLIIPNTWMYLFSTEPIREKILTETKIISIVELTKGIFTDAPDTVPVIIILKKCAFKEGDIKNTFNACSFSNQNSMNYEDFINAKYKKIMQSDIYENKCKVFNLNLTPEIKQLLAKIRSTPNTPLSGLAKANYGIKTGDNEKYLSNTRINNKYKKCLKTKEIRRYSIEWKNLWLNYGDYLSGYRSEPLDVPKIVVQYIRKLSLNRRLICAFDEKGEYYPLNNYSYICDNHNEPDKLKYLIGILNSKLMNFYFANTFIDYNIKTTYLGDLPIVERKQEELIDLTSKILSLNDSLLKFGDKKTSDSARIEEEIRDTDGRIDEKVYEIYNLEKEERDIVDKSTDLPKTEISAKAMAD